MLPVIFGLAGPVMSDREAHFFRECQPVGYILFKRNVVSRKQLRALTDSLRELTGRDNTPILVDQEGGRVARLGAPEWPEYPAAMAFARAYEQHPDRACRAIQANFEALALDLAEAGITVDCAPVLDVPQPDANEVIGDRALGRDVETIAALGQATLDGLAAGGVVGVIKHMPGHGRAQADSHEALPTVSASDAELSMDLEPFQRLAHAPMGMTAHVRYLAWDQEDCATLSSTIINSVIRQRIGFEGLLLSDDLDMKALSGDVPTRAARALAAGCDVALNCWGKMDDMEGIAAMVPSATLDCQHRLAEAMARLQPLGQGANLKRQQRALIAERDALLSELVC